MRPACEEVVKGIKAKGGEATAVAASISEKAQLENLVAEARKAYGRIDIMVCNAASNPYFGPLTGLKEEVFQKIMQNNVMSNLCFCGRTNEAVGKAVILFHPFRHLHTVNGVLHGDDTSMHVVMPGRVANDAAPVHELAFLSMATVAQT